MKPLLSSFSHINLNSNPKSRTRKDWTKPYKLDDILKASPKKIATYDELVKDVAQLQHHNRKFNLFFRGQAKEHLDSNLRTTILAKIFRKELGETKLLLKDRFDVLRKNVEKLRNAFDVRDKKLAGTHLLNKYDEVCWSILQHYQVCPTPLIDLSHSLHVACSFAFEGNNGKSGVIYILGLPWPTDAISYNTYEELVNIRLLSICPPQAQRPFFQEGYLLGNFPYYKLDEPNRVKQFDPSRRIVAKFEIPIDNSFWGNEFKKLPTSKIYPVSDRVKTICESIKETK